MKSSLPVRIQRKRTKGWRMPENTVYVGRGSKWGNPFVVGKPVPKIWLHGEFDYFDTKQYLHDAIVPTAQEAVRLFAKYVLDKEAAQELRGKNQACWCALDGPCHANQLLEAANV